jgi:1-acyl-sn-glycerol-3-phosphate acyltransferase
MPKQVLGDDPFAPPKPAAPATSERPEPAPERPSPPSAPRPPRAPSVVSAPPQVAPSEPPARAPEPPPPLEDGAAARRASRATAHQREPAGYARVQPSIDPGLNGSAAPVRPIADGLRRLEEQLARSWRGELTRAEPGGVLDRLLRLLDPKTLRGWIVEHKMRGRSETVDEFGLDPVYADRWRPLMEFLYRRYWRVEAVGMENLPDRGRALIVANHAGTLPYDGAMLMFAGRYDHPAHRDIRPLVEDVIFHFPFLGVALNRIGCVRACPENGARLLEHGGVVAVFPEGLKGIGKLYRQRYQLQRFGRGGFIKLALQSRAPIIPTAIVGSEEIHPMIGRLTWLTKYLGVPYVPITPTFPWLGLVGAIPLPTKWMIRFGEPLRVADQYKPEDADDPILVNRISEQVRSTIQAMVDEALLGRRSVLFG